MSSRHKGISGVIQWLASDACHDADDAGLAAGVAQRLRAVGIPLDLLTLHLKALHPEILGRRIAWSPHRPAQVFDREHGLDRSGAIARSPIGYVIETQEAITLRSGDPRMADWTQLELFRGGDLAEIRLFPLRHDEALASAAAFGTCNPGGFSDADRLALATVIPSLRSACELRLRKRSEETLLDTYLGATTSRRILAGHVRRGDVENLEAALFLCDLRDFTGLSDRLPEAEVLRLLNVYFDQVVPSITEAGGEILKFMGDAVFAFFHREDDAAGACADAFDAAQAGLARLEAASRANDTQLEAGVALHYGRVSYGNIGSGHRLDFTVIGRDVNLTSRLQGVSATAGRSIVMSPTFAAHIARPEIVSIGRYPIKGLAHPLEVFSAGSMGVEMRRKLPQTHPAGGLSEPRA